MRSPLISGTTKNDRVTTIENDGTTSKKSWKKVDVFEKIQKINEKIQKKL